ncbi:MAG: YfcE family phosphodiesterase [Clostridia bacterium]|nr:YfcE family phosphodiesterase [Clostridia bacterium]
MNVLVLSDSHGNCGNLNEAFTRCRDCDLAVFLGDGLNDFYSVSAGFNMMTAEVRGNCDLFAAGVPETRVLDLEGFRILITHGHRFGVKYGFDALIKEALVKNCDMVLFGHTHQKTELRVQTGKDDKKLILFNPGSISSSYGEKPSFGRINLKQKGDSFFALCSHGEL